MRTWQWAILALALSVSGGCGKLAEKITGKAIEKAVEESSGGDASLSLDGNIDISDIPAAFRYPGMKGVARIAQNTSTSTGTVYMLESEDSLEKVKTHYEAIAGYKQISKLEQPGIDPVFTYETAPKESCIIQLSTRSAKTAIILTFAKEKT